MKGIAHFASGLVAVSFVPGVVEQAAQGSLLIALGGACAMLPDWLDFRFARFLEKRDANIAPDLIQPSPQKIADQIAEQFALARQTRQPRIVQFHPARRGVVDWLLYSFKFDNNEHAVVVDMNGETARAAIGNVDYTYDGSLDVGELGGPSLKFVTSEEDPNAIKVEFLAWHRAWSHSLVIALGLGLVVGVLMNPLAGVVAGLGFAVHVLEDQLGYMGSNLFAPFTRRRSNGLKLIHSGDTIPNMVTVWLSLSLLLLNLDRAQDIPLLPLGTYLAFVVGLPSLVLIGIYARRKWRKYAIHLPAEQGKDLTAELQPVSADA